MLSGQGCGLSAVVDNSQTASGSGLTDNTGSGGYLQREMVDGRITDNGPAVCIFPAVKDIGGQPGERHARLE